MYMLFEWTFQTIPEVYIIYVNYRITELPPRLINLSLDYYNLYSIFFNFCFILLKCLLIMTIVERVKKIVILKKSMILLYYQRKYSFNLTDINMSPL